MPMLLMLFLFVLVMLAGSLVLLWAKIKLIAFAGTRFNSLLENFGSGNALKTTRFHSRSPLTEVEQDLFKRLVKALPDHFILSQVALSQVLYTSGADRKEEFGAMATMKQKVADFIVCNQRFDIVAVIELDDSTHDPRKDAVRDANLKEAGLKTVRWHVSRKPDAAMIRWDVLGIKDGPDGELVSRWAPRPS